MSMIFLSLLIILIKKKLKSTLKNNSTFTYDFNIKNKISFLDVLVDSNSHKATPSQPYYIKTHLFPYTILQTTYLHQANIRRQWISYVIYRQIKL